MMQSIPRMGCMSLWGGGGGLRRGYIILVLIIPIEHGFTVLFVSQGFDHHIQHDHNMWNYIYYSIYLNQIDVSDHNAIEQYVFRQVWIYIVEIAKILITKCRLLLLD